MQDNNIFENSNNFDNSQPDNEAENQVNSVTEASDYTKFNASEQVDENDFDLDPELTSDTTENTEQNTSHYANYEEPPIEPIAPIMPKIEKNDYELIEKSNSSKGIKVFAVILSLLIIVSASVTGGYYLGANQNNKAPVVDLASKPNPDKALTVSQIFSEVSPSVVGIHAYSAEDGTVFSATGVIYSKDGYIITNDHIYANIAAAKFKVYTHDNKVYSATYVGGDTRSDIAVLKITDASNVTFKPAVLGNSDQAVVGEGVVAIGRPNGANYSSIATEGIISTTSIRVSTTSNYTNNFIQIDSAINPGNSGGALCNIYGQVIGITSAKLVGAQYDGVGYALPMTTVKKVVDSLIKYKTVKNRARLGISYYHIDELSAELSKVPCGLQIAEIDKSSDLYGKSVSANDIITHVNSTKITDPNFVLDIVDASKPGDTLNLTIYSAESKKSFEINVKLLEDVSSSSYTLEKQENNNSNSNNNGNNNYYNSSEFSFPNGE
ncbi:MAG: trypsin-like peptidase domain-containing protein [Clostridia bacterium]|nr:trypsin-like peptidase domain-containing protein [Clostridia bacterium]